jgi:hypothetical protein
MQVGDAAVTLDDFRAYLPQHGYIYLPTYELWPAASVNASIPPIPTGRTGEDGKAILIKPSLWLDQQRAVHQMTWAPGHDTLISNRLIVDGGWIEQLGVTCFNLYRPPLPISDSADPDKAGPWIAHVERLLGHAESKHTIRWLADRVQCPGKKVNHALVLGGAQGIGKDTLLEPVKRSVGPWNFAEVAPTHLLGRFNGWLKSVILRVNEARDLGDVNRYSFYEHMKSYTAAPPDVLRVDEKNLREYSVMNVCGVIITTNHKTDGLYLPADDRRHFVAWSDRTKEEFGADYFRKMYAWYQSGGIEHVAAYLHQLDLSDFDAKAPPPKTAAFWIIADANRAPEDAELADALDALQFPEATTLAQLADHSPNGLGEWLRDRRNARQVPHRLETAGYVPVRNDAAKDGLYKVAGKRQVVYAHAKLTLRDQIAAANRLVEAIR